MGAQAEVEACARGLCVDLSTHCKRAEEDFEEKDFSIGSVGSRDH